MGVTAPEIVIIGSGFAGLCMGIKLLEAGMTRFVILERAGAIGGTWRDNTYPGCGCDVKSRLYSFSFEPNPGWSQLFARQAEIQAYLEHCVEKYGLGPYIRLNQNVVEARFDEQANEWNVRTAAGDAYSARVLISGMGGLSNPTFPSIAGLETFQGKCFHSAQWDHQYDLRGKRVAVIGTGASAIQFVPEIAPQVERLDLYQRSAPYILPRHDRQISRCEQWIFRRFPFVQRFLRGALYWWMEGRVLGFVVDPRLMTLGARAALDYLAKEVPDPTLRQKLTPTYQFGCKRVLISDGYYQGVSRPNVDIVTDGIREVKAHSIVDQNGRERDIDAIILGTGFQAQSPVPRNTVFGVRGVDLRAVWEKSAEAFKGTTVHGFPNLFILVGPNTGVGHTSMVYIIESQVQYVLSALKQMAARGIRRLEVKASAQQAYNERLQSKANRAIWASGCKSWYLDEQGKNTTLWPDFTFRFRAETRALSLDDYELIAASES